MNFSSQWEVKALFAESTTMEITNRLRQAGNRIGGDLHDLIESLPGYAAVALGLNYRDSERVAVAATDGRTIFAGPEYSGYGDQERRFILTHEMLHVVLGHIPRTELLRRMDPDQFDPLLANLVQDALINTALIAEHRQGEKNWRWVKVPDNAIRLGPILKAIGDLDEKAETDEDLGRCGDYSFEELYFRLRKVAPTGWTTLLEGDVWSEPGAGHGRDRQSDGGAGEEGSGGEKAGSVGIDGYSSDAQLQEQIQQAFEQQSLMQGHLKGTIQRLVKEFPRVETPWEKVLVAWLTKRIRGNRKLDFSRPSRRFSALEGEFAKQGVSLPFDPDRSLRRTGRLVIAVDTSGSISDEMLAMFYGHMAVIIRQWTPQVLILAADADIHETYELEGPRALDRLRQVTLSGGGGTDFKPAIERAGRFRPDAMVYLTDLMGDCGEEPRFPVLWALLPGLAETPPWGKVLTLK